MFEQGEVVIDDWQPDKLIDALKEHSLVVWCWTCMNLLYTSSEKNQITLRVSSDTQFGHHDFFSDKHTVVEYGTEEMQ
jgi:hypothetical protein